MLLARWKESGAAVIFVQRGQIETEENRFCAAQKSSMLKKIAATRAVNGLFMRA
jgi:hypothetical protein